MDEVWELYEVTLGLEYAISQYCDVVQQEIKEDFRNVFGGGSEVIKEAIGKTSVRSGEDLVGVGSLVKVHSDKFVYLLFRADKAGGLPLVIKVEK